MKGPAGERIARGPKVHSIDSMTALDGLGSPSYRLCQPVAVGEDRIDGVLIRVVVRRQGVEQIVRLLDGQAGLGIRVRSRIRDRRRFLLAGRDVDRHRSQGTPKQTIEDLLEFVKLGVSDFVFMFDAPGDYRTLELLATKVAPAVRAQGPKLVAASVA